MAPPAEVTTCSITPTPPGESYGWDAVPLERLLRAGTSLPLHIDNGARTMGQATAPPADSSPRRCSRGGWCL